MALSHLELTELLKNRIVSAEQGVLRGPVEGASMSLMRLYAIRDLAQEILRRLGE